MPARKRFVPQSVFPVVHAVAYARVSSKDQAVEGFSIPAQQRLLREYAAEHGIIIVQEFVDVETARRSGREGFGQMLEFLTQQPRITTILTEKVDRMYRNIADWVRVDDLCVTVHFVKERSIIGPESRSSDQLMHGIKVLMARNYSMNLSEESRKGAVEKARAGLYPSCAPTGYRNVQGPDGKRIIIPHPEEAVVITELYRRFATGNYSIKDLAAITRKEGLLLAGKPLHASTLHLLLRRRLYCGEFDYDGVTYHGTHEPLVTKETWSTVQRLLDQRKNGHTKAIRRAFPFTGLVKCGHCGLAMVGEAKKGRYVYWHCTGHRGKHPEEPYVRQEALIDEFASVLGDLIIPKEVLEWLATEVTASDTTEAAARQATSKRLEGEVRRIEQRLRILYEDRLEERIALALYEEKRALLQAQLTSAPEKLLKSRDAAVPPLTTALDLMRMTSNAASAFREQPEAAQRQLLTATLKEATWKDQHLQATLLEPFELLRRSNQHNSNGNNGLGGNGRNFENWLLR